MPSSVEANVLWGVSLLIAVAVLAVVVLILTIIFRTAVLIDEGAKEIWVVAKNDANSTIHLALLGRTNQLVADILEAGTGILHHAGRIAQHAQTCKGCPSCVLAPSGPFIQSPVNPGPPTRPDLPGGAS